jgi:hypothetical protein
LGELESCVAHGLTIDEGIEDELPVLLHQIVDVAKNATVDTYLLAFPLPIASFWRGPFSAGRSQDRGELLLSQESARGSGGAYHMVFQGRMDNGQKLEKLRFVLQIRGGVSRQEKPLSRKNRDDGEGSERERRRFVVLAMGRRELGQL